MASLKELSRIRHPAWGIHSGLCVGVLAAAVNALVVKIALPHLFDSLAQFLGWTAQLVLWYAAIVAAGSGFLGAIVALLDRSARRRSREDLSRFYFWAGVGGVAIAWAGNVLNFGWLPRPLRPDAPHIVSNSLLLVTLGTLTVVLIKKTRWPRYLGRRRERALMAVAVVGVGAVSGLRMARPSTALSYESAIESNPDDTPLALQERAGGENHRRLNLLLLTVDTLRADHLGFYGYSRDTSPFLDSLAAQSVVFEKAFTEKPRTSPSIASIMTGTYPRRHGVHNTNEVFAPEHLTLAELLRDAGYQTAAIVTNANLYPVYGFDQGFQRYAYGDHRAEQQTELGLQWLEQGPGEPFFFWIHYVDPHRPYAPPAPYHALYQGSPRPGTTRAARKAYPLEDGTIDWQIVPKDVTFDRHIARYDGEIRYTDDQIARLIESFRSHGLLDRTLLVFTADHGESFGEHGVFGHGPTTHDSNARIPLFFRLPGVLRAGRRVEGIAGGVDIAPTILELLAVPIPARMQGKSRAEWMLGPEKSPESTYALIEAGFGVHIYRGIQQALRTPGWKYVWRDTTWIRTIRSPLDIFWFWNAMLEGGLNSDELYDLRMDPDETTNVISKRRDKAIQMRAALWTALSRQGPPAPQAKSIPWTELPRISPETERALRALGYVN